MIEPSQTPSENRPEHDWRDPSKPWNTEDDGVVAGWRRRADGTWERVDTELESDANIEVNENGD